MAEHRAPAEMSAWLREQPRSLPFEEVWRDLVALIGNGREFVTTTKQTPFLVEIADASSTGQLRIRASRKTSLFERKELARLWFDLRAHGVATSGPLDGRESSYIFPIVAALPYVKLVQLADDFEKFSFSKQLGLQLVPAPRPVKPLQSSLAFVG